MAEPLSNLGDVQGALADIGVPAYALDKRGSIRWLNQAAMDIFGDARGSDFTVIVAPEESLRAREAFSRNIMRGTGADHEDLLVLRPDGRRVNVEICSAPLRDGHHVVGMFGIAVREDESTPPPRRHLTPRLHQVLLLLAAGRSTEQIAGELHLSVTTVRNHVRRLLRSLGAHSRLEALAIARRDGLLTA